MGVLLPSYNFIALHYFLYYGLYCIAALISLNIYADLTNRYRNQRPYRKTENYTFKFLNWKIIFHQLGRSKCKQRNIHKSLIESLGELLRSSKAQEI
jgi:hypothetical protein